MSLSDAFDGARLLKAQGQNRYFLVPLGTPLPAGTFRVRNEHGRQETLKLGKLQHWEIVEESAHLILEHRAAVAGANAAAVLNGLFAALDIRGESLEQAVSALARAASERPEDKAELQARIKRQQQASTSPLVKQSLAKLAASFASRSSP